MEININNELRPCIVNGRKALFHKWSNESQVVDPSPLRGGHNGGTLAWVTGIIEYEDGSVTKCYPTQIQFVDNKIKDFAFPQEE